MYRQLRIVLSCRQFFFNYRQVRKIVVRILPPGPQSRSATFWSAVYPFTGPQVRSPHFTPGRELLRVCVRIVRMH